MQRTPTTAPNLSPDDLGLPLLRPPQRTPTGNSERSIPDSAARFDDHDEDNNSDMNLLRSHTNSSIAHTSSPRRPRSARSAPISDNDDDYEELTPSAQLLLMASKGNGTNAAAQSPGSATAPLTFVPATISFTSMRPKRLKRVSKYVLGPLLGEGTFGHVRDAIDLGQQCPERVAVKTIRRKLRRESDLRRIEASLQNEIDHLQRFHHPNVIRALDIFCRDGKDYMVLPIAVCSLEQLVQYRREEIAIKQTMSDRGSNISFAESCNNLKLSANALLPVRLVQDLLFQLLSGVEYLHKQGIAHNDLKPANILLYADGVVKITDLGSCATSYRGRGTAAFVSPEAARGEEVDHKKNDTWCCGLVLYYLLTNMLPFRREGSQTEFQLYQDIANKEINFDVVPEAANPAASKYLDVNSARSVGAASGAVVGPHGTTARSLLRGMLEKDQSKRMSVTEALEHPWLRITWEKAPATAPQSIPPPSSASDGAAAAAAAAQRSSGSSGGSSGENSRNSGNNRDAIINSSAVNLKRAFNVRDIAELIYFDKIRHLQFLAEVCYIVGVPLPGKVFATPAELAALRAKWLDGCVTSGLHADGAGAGTSSRTVDATADQQRRSSGGSSGSGSSKRPVTASQNGGKGTAEPQEEFVATVDRSLFGATDLNHYSRKGYPECDVKSLRVDQTKKAFLATYLDKALRDRGFFGSGNGKQQQGEVLDSSACKCACSVM